MNKKIIGLSAIAIILGTIGASAIPAFAYRGDPTVTGPNYDPARHDAIVAAMTKLDYNTWKDLMAGRGRVTKVITADNFAKFVEARNLALQGKTAEANAIRAELGLGQGSRGGYGQGRNCTK